MKWRPEEKLVNKKYDNENIILDYIYKQYTYFRSRSK